MLIAKLRGVGVLTWVYALVQMIDMRFYNSRWARRRRASMGIPDSLHGWLFGQMLAWFGILYYGLTEDLRWYVAGLVILGLSFLVFPIRKRGLRSRFRPRSRRSVLLARRRCLPSRDGGQHISVMSVNPHPDDDMLSPARSHS